MVEEESPIEQIYQSATFWRWATISLIILILWETWSRVI